MSTTRPTASRVGAAVTAVVAVATAVGVGVLAGRTLALRENIREGKDQRACTEAVVTHLVAASADAEHPPVITSLTITPTESAWQVQMTYTAGPAGGEVTYQCRIVSGTPQVTR